MKEPEDGDSETEEGMVNALLLNGDGEDAVFECFADTQECNCMTLEFDEEEGTGEVLTNEQKEELEKLRESDEHCDYSEGCHCPYCENSPKFVDDPDSAE